MGIVANVGGKEYRVGFRHDRVGQMVVEPGGQYHRTGTLERPVKRPHVGTLDWKSCSAITTCMIYSGDILVAEGKAYCSFKDQFNKRRGRIISLGRATESLPYDIKCAIWEAYTHRR